MTELISYDEVYSCRDEVSNVTLSLSSKNTSISSNSYNNSMTENPLKMTRNPFKNRKVNINDNVNDCSNYEEREAFSMQKTPFMWHKQVNLFGKHSAVNSLRLSFSRSSLVSKLVRDSFQYK